MPLRNRSLSLALALLALAPAGAVAGDGKIVFQSARDSNADYELYVMDGDGTDVRRLTHSRGWDQWPAWSPDGTRIAFTSRRGGGLGDVYVMPAAGGSPARLTNVPTRFDSNEGPEWTPDAAALLYSSTTGAGNTGMDAFRVGADGSGARQILALTGPSVVSDISPQGRVLLTAQPDGERFKDSDLFTMQPDGTGLVRLTSTPGVMEGSPAWSPDGRRIAFAVQAGPRSHLEVIDADGGGRRVLTDGDDDRAPAWSPEGDRVLFDRVVGDSAQLHLIPAAGGPVRQLTFGLDYRHNIQGDWIAGTAPHARTGKLRSLRAGAASTTSRWVRVGYALTAPARIRFTVHKCRGARACEPGHKVFDGRMDGGDPTELLLTELPAAGRYRVRATAGGATRDAILRVG